MSAFDPSVLPKGAKSNMDVDWLPRVLPILNAAGVPLLAIGIVLLVRAYQRAVETYKGTVSHLNVENDRLRKRLAQVDESYFADFLKMKGIASKSLEVIEELQIKKISLLSRSADQSSEQSVLSDVRKINDAIEMLSKLTLFHSTFENTFRDHATRVRQEFVSMSSRIGEIAERIGDIGGRFTLVGVLASGRGLQNIKVEQEMAEAEGRSRGLVSNEPLADPQEEDEGSDSVRMLRSNTEAAGGNDDTNPLGIEG